MDLTSLSEKLVKSPWALILGALMLVMTMLGTHFATSSDLQTLGEDVRVIKEDVAPLKHRVTNLEEDVIKIDDKVNKELSTVDKRMKAASEERSDLNDSYHDIEVRMERMNGNQEVANEKLEHIKMLFQTYAKESK
jgi:predicted  nucleic acid-binding Zn-ribbon protein